MSISVEDLLDAIVRKGWSGDRDWVQYVGDRCRW